MNVGFRVLLEVFFLLACFCICSCGLSSKDQDVRREEMIHSILLEQKREVRKETDSLCRANLEIRARETADSLVQVRLREIKRKLEEKSK